MHHIKTLLKSLILYTFSLFLIAVSFSNCVPSPDRLKSNKSSAVTPPDKGYSIIFYEIDNYAEVYVDGKMIGDTRSIAGDADKKEIMIDLSKSINKRSKEISIKVHNLPCTTCRTNTWKATYGIYKDGTEIEYVGEASTGQAEIGHVFTKKHTL